MATGTFFARADSNTANNPNLNPIGTGRNGFPTTAITFTDLNGAGDLLLDTNNGLADPDTLVIINGVAYAFTFQFVGTLPFGNSQVPDALEGKQVALITVVIDGRTLRLFFLTDGTGTLALMNQIGSGAISLVGYTTNPPPIFVCFCTGTMIATPAGSRAVESLAPGDLVLNEDGAARPILWVGKSRVALADLRRDPDLRPIRIPAHAFGPARPEADLLVSPQHRIVLEGAPVELMFGEARVLVAAKHLVGTFAAIVAPEADVEYFHILTEEHEILLSNGLPTESFQPARRTIDVMAGATRAALEAALTALGLEDMLTRPDALLCLKRGEVLPLVTAMQRSSARYAETRRPVAGSRASCREAATSAIPPRITTVAFTSGWSARGPNAAGNSATAVAKISRAT